MSLSPSNMLPLPHPSPPPSDHEETHTEFPDSEFLSIRKPMINNKKNSLLEQEKQISIDPISLKESSTPHPPPSTTIATTKAKFTALLPPLLPPTKTKFLSTSLPCSATSSPRFSSSLSKKKHWKINQIQPSPASSVIDPLSRQHSVALSRLAQLQEKHLRRSKSCGDGRATSPSDDFDRLWLNKVNKNETVVIKKEEYMEAYDDDDDDRDRDEKFKCGALCLFLPGFGRGKPVSRPRKDLENGNEFHRKEKKKGNEIIMGVMSRTVSLEKFECGSWTSSAIIVDQNEEDADPTNNLFFDLPLELIRNEMNDADSPVTAAFVFDKQQLCGDRKGVLKKSRSSTSRGANCSNGRKSQDSSSTRHVRFCSTSNNSSPRSQPTSPANSCISPRLRKAREDFNAFLEAQSA